MKLAAFTIVPRFSLPLHYPCVFHGRIATQSSCNYSSSITNSNTSPTELIDFKRVQEFAKENPHVATMALQPPPLLLHNHDDKSRNTFEDYLRWRGWDSQYIENPMTNALLSHALTFPLTLASQVSHFLPSRRGGIMKEEGSIVPHDVNICCVGSRAEANLPDEYWREFLIAFNYFFNPSSPGTPGDIVVVHWNIDCIGPEVKTKSRSSSFGMMNSKSHSQQSDSRCIRLRQDRVDNDNDVDGSSVTLNYHQEYLHNHVVRNLYRRRRRQEKIDITEGTTVVEEILNNWDGFVLFNPGIAHPHLIQSWNPTMDFILKTQKSIIITAHSNIDKVRDQNLLRHLIMSKMVEGRERGDKNNFSQEQEVMTVQKMVKGLVKYNMNSFASKMVFEDPFATDGNETMVRPNHSVCLIALDDMGHRGVFSNNVTRI